MSDWRSLQKCLVAVLVLLLTRLEPAASYCSQGSDWIEFEGHCYRRTFASVNWFRAELECRKSDANLVSIESARHNDFLLRLVQCRAYWVGMVNTDPAQRLSLKSYDWLDGTVHNYTRLSPQNVAYVDCVYANSAGTWYNTYCQTGYNYVCKAPAVTGGVGSSRAILSAKQSGDQKQGDAQAVWYTTPDYEIDIGTTAGEPDTTPQYEASRPTTRPHLTTRAHLRCPSGWQQFDNNCYFVSSDSVNYFNAQMSCQAMGATVASVLTPREHSLVTIALGCNVQAWIGLEKARPCFRQPSKDHCWVWMDRSPVNYFEWNSGQPHDSREAECVILNGQWTVTNCYNAYRYICKKQPA